MVWPFTPPGISVPLPPPVVPVPLPVRPSIASGVGDLYPAPVLIAGRAAAAAAARQDEQQASHRQAPDSPGRA